MEMQEARNAEGFTGKTEKLLIANMIKAAKNNSRIGDKEPIQEGNSKKRNKEDYDNVKENN